MNGLPDYLQSNPEGVACWHRVHTRLLAMGQWEPQFANGLGLLACQCSAYLNFAKQVRRLKNIDRLPVTDLEIGLAETHRIARKLMAEFLVITPERVKIIPVDQVGDDLEILRLCAPIQPSWTVTQ